MLITGELSGGTCTSYRLLLGSNIRDLDFIRKILIKPLLYKKKKKERKAAWGVGCREGGEEELVHYLGGEELRQTSQRGLKRHSTHQTSNRGHSLNKDAVKEPSTPYVWVCESGYRTWHVHCILSTLLEGRGRVLYLPSCSSNRITFLPPLVELSHFPA